MPRAAATPTLPMFRPQTQFGRRLAVDERRGRRDLRPDGVRQERGRGGARRSARDGGRLGGRDAGRTADCRSSRTSRSGLPGSSGSGRLDEGCPSASTRRSRTPRSTSSSRERGAAVVAGGTGLYLRAALADLGCPRRRRPRCARLGARPGRRDRGRGARPAPRDATRARRRRCTRNDRQRLVRALELAEAGASLAPAEDGSGRGRRAIRRWSSGWRSPPEELEPPDRGADRWRCSRRGVVDGGPAGARRQASRRRRRSARAREIATLRATRRSSASSSDAPVRGVPAEVDAADPRDRPGRRPAPDAPEVILTRATVVPRGGVARRSGVTQAARIVSACARDAVREVARPRQLATSSSSSPTLAPDADARARLVRRRARGSAATASSRSWPAMARSRSS